MNARKGIKTYHTIRKGHCAPGQKKMNARKGIKTHTATTMLLMMAKSEEDECPQGH